MRILKEVITAAVLKDGRDVIVKQVGLGFFFITILQLYFYNPNVEKVEGAYCFGPICASVRASVRPLRFAYGQERLEIGS